MLILNLYIPYIFLHLCILVFFILFQNKTPKCITEIPNQIKHLSLEPNQNGFPNKISNYDRNPSWIFIYLKRKTFVYLDSSL